MFHYYSYELPSGHFQAIATAQYAKEARENASFQARGCTATRRAAGQEAKRCRYFIDTDLDALRRTLVKTMMGNLCERHGVASFTQTEWAAILNYSSSQTMNYKLNGRQPFTEGDEEFLSILLQMDGDLAKKIISERILKTFEIKRKNNIHQRKYRKKNKSKRE